MYNGETLKGSEKIPKKVVSDASRDAGEKFERRSGLFWWWTWLYFAQEVHALQWDTHSALTPA